MTTSIRYNGQIPPAQIIVLFLSLACIAYASTLNNEQAQALTATGGIAEFASLLFRFISERR
ncbi:hypothetical protein ACWC09_26390 [Streptomyces sp. NPDC001617]